MPDVDPIKQAKSLYLKGLETPQICTSILLEIYLPRLAPPLIRCTSHLKSLITKSWNLVSNFTFVISAIGLAGFVPAILEYERNGLTQRQHEEYRKLMLGTSSPAVTPLALPQMLVAGSANVADQKQ